MPQFALHTYSSQFFWLMVCWVFLWFGFRWGILPRYQRNQVARNERQLALLRASESLELKIIEQEQATQQVLAAGAQKAKERFHEARHRLDQEDHAIQSQWSRAQKERLHLHLQTYSTHSQHIKKVVQPMIADLKLMIQKYLKGIIK